jgi:dienelactone hydrolase
MPGDILRAAVSGAAAVLLAAGVARSAPIVEERVLVPVHSSPGAVPGFDQTIAVAIVRESATGRRPFLILEHGRSGDPAERARLALPVYPANSRYFAALGFVVVIPLRVGYGVSGGPDVEYTGDCRDKQFAAGVAPAVEETRQVATYLRGLPYVDSGRGLVVGESFGGLIAIAIAGGRDPGLMGAVNVAGGDGGDSLHRPDEPCAPDRLRAAFAQWGATSHVQTLWMYSANDRLWGGVYPRQWFDAYTAAGGAGSFAPLPADKNNGHFIFNRNAAAWHPAFERFIATLGFGAAAHPGP